MNRLSKYSIGLLVFMTALLVSTYAWSAWKYNPFTHKQDYYNNQASEITALNTTSGLTSTDVQGQLDELKSSIDAFVANTSGIDDTAYDAASWNGETTLAPSKNAVRDKIELILGTTLPAAYQPLESTLTDIADGTITENLVNTANP